MNYNDQIISYAFGTVIAIECQTIGRHGFKTTWIGAIDDVIVSNRTFESILDARADAEAFQGRCIAMGVAQGLLEISRPDTRDPMEVEADPVGMPVHVTAKVSDSENMKAFLREFEDIHVQVNLNDVIYPTAEEALRLGFVDHSEDHHLPGVLTLVLTSEGELWLDARNVS